MLDNLLNLAGMLDNLVHVWENLFPLAIEHVQDYLAHLQDLITTSADI